MLIWKIREEFEFLFDPNGLRSKYYAKWDPEMAAAMLNTEEY